MRRLAWTLAGAALAVANGPALAQQETAASSGYVMPETETLTLRSKAGIQYSIFVSRPTGEAPPGGYPVLYVLDANAMFAGFAEARRIHTGYFGDHHKMIVVGIGYPVDTPYAPRRMEDFTAPFRSAELAAKFRDYRSGGREAFLGFITDTLMPEMARRFSIDASRQSLYGHSLGGLFALYALYTQPGLFHATIAASPALWWDDQQILNDERVFRDRLLASKRVERISRLLVLIGAEEEYPVMVDDSVALVERLRPLSGYGMRARIEVLEDERHLTVPSRSITPTMRIAMESP
ncbi:alpha/beta hydrolase [Croceicoccus ponticola]|uniref:Alpha/beta hydrolase n=1 Tax=Croceicoccus ponticola TaxID=2217664 RepID=A0A437GW79_9SPHN|nr:alpha/beta hydrolase-fold protein [Croceicoccus ponticola]RVQ66365.1 alpha/beta hydrolase [Croceicoccus ponticola]